MSGGASQAASEATRLNMQLSSEEFQLGLGALTQGLRYTSAMDKMGPEGIDKMLAPKFDAKMTDVIEGSAMRPSGAGFRGDIEAVGRSSTARAVGATGVAQERIGQGLDIVNSIKSTLAGHGLKTTGLSQQAGSLQGAAISLMAPNPTMSTILGAAGAASAAYGAYGQKQAADAAASQERISRFYAGQGVPGSDVSILSGAPSSSATKTVHP